MFSLARTYQPISILLVNLMVSLMLFCVPSHAQEDPPVQENQETAPAAPPDPNSPPMSEDNSSLAQENSPSVESAAPQQEANPPPPTEQPASASTSDRTDQIKVLEETELTPAGEGKQNVLRSLYGNLTILGDDPYSTKFSTTYFATLLENNSGIETSQVTKPNLIQEMKIFVPVSNSFLTDFTQVILILQGYDPLISKLVGSFLGQDGINPVSVRNPLRLEQAHFLSSFMCRTPERMMCLSVPQNFWIELYQKSTEAQGVGFSMSYSRPVISFVCYNEGEKTYFTSHDPVVGARCRSVLFPHDLFAVGALLQP
ncbi:MAG: hypothetical protein COT74_05320 [Bdellovibrionales bacterium CG10_big_fil_rev_8_21_14_0_10_45_34]|nr:MAG: hypothetical protein COT74_05320 [Bdellovibrionales bacterium CG10_big_fil_rev_8_21_14_0_10_45_34]